MTNQGDDDAVLFREGAPNSGKNNHLAESGTQNSGAISRTIRAHVSHFFSERDWALQAVIIIALLGLACALFSPLSALWLWGIR